MSMMSHLLIISKYHDEVCFLVKEEYFVPISLVEHEIISVIISVTTLVANRAKMRKTEKKYVMKSL